MQKFSLEKTVESGDPKMIEDFLARHCDLSKGRIKNAMNKGAVWLKKTKGKQNRIRRATTPLKTVATIKYLENILLLHKMRN
jgi:hypothetical protein